MWERWTAAESYEDGYHKERTSASWPIALNGTNISECSNYVHPGRKVNMANGLAPELYRRKRATWGAFKSIEAVVKKTSGSAQEKSVSQSLAVPRF
ncbi:unnamed protein product [Heligmosomoides polygyrus]|uniref:Uncharacterized protein n=1 Tax=Heligmosomoides polygyrus TaxID=6339 RepID=A0A183GBX5_HELPZ|nr:unnamed protein product [Heligmosomoides polygyrus]